MGFAVHPTAFLIAGVTFVMFVAVELWRDDPLVELRLYKNVGFAIVSVVILINAVNFWASNFMQTILMQRTLDYTPAQAGFATLPGAFIMAFTTLGAGRLADILDRRLIVLFGLGLFALSCYWFSYVTLDTPMQVIIWMIVGRYFSIAFVFTPMNAASLMTLPADRVRMGSGLINIMQQGLGDHRHRGHDHISRAPDQLSRQYARPTASPVVAALDPMVGAGARIPG